MKKANFILMIIFSWILLIPALASEKPSKPEKPKRPRGEVNDKVGLSRQPITTRSISTAVEAYTDNRCVVAVEISDYSGSVFAEVLSGRGSIQKTFIVNGSGSEDIDVSNFRSGTYTLRVVLDGETYEGTFTKKYYGR